MFQIRFAPIIASVVAFGRQSSATATLVALMLVSFTPTLIAQVQPPEVEWEKTYGGASSDWASSVQQTFDANGNPTGYIVAGGIRSFGAGESDVYLIKTDANGNVSPGWPKTFGGPLIDSSHSVKQTADGGYIVAGWTGLVPNEPTSDLYLIKLDATGNVAPDWPKTFGGAGDDVAYSVQQTSDAGYIVAGWTESFGAGGRDVFLLKLDPQGNLDPAWPENPKTFGGALNDSAESVQQTADDGYIVAGMTESFGAGWKDVYLIKLDPKGNLDPAWSQNPKTFGGARVDGAYSVQQTADDGYIVAGLTESFGAGGVDIYLIKLDPKGNLNPAWSQNPKTFGGANRDEANSIQQTKDGGYIVAGWTESFGAGNQDVYLIKLKPDQPLPPKRIQLNIFDAAQELWFPLNEQARKDLFKPALPVVVIVHGWNNELLNTLPTYTNDLAEVFAARLPNQVNILAWDWLQEAKGDATQPNDLILGPNPSALHVWDQSKKLARALQQLFQADPTTRFEQPIHLMGHSNGAFLVALTAIVLQSPSFGNGVYPVANVTLWDPPNLIRNSLANNVPYLRRVHGTTVDLISGTLNSNTYFSNAWVAVPGSLEVPGLGHDTYRWYQAYAPTDREPTLHRSIFCGDEILPTTVGFGASRTHAPPDRQLRLSCPPAEPPVELDVSLVAKPLACEPTDHLVFAQYCIADSLTPTPVITVKVDNGIGNLYCNCEVPSDLRLRMQLRRPAGIGGGAGVDPEPLVATYTLPQTIAQEFDSLTFTYRIEAAPSPATFTVSVDDGVSTVPLFLATSAADLGQGDQDSTHINITPYHGKEVNLIFGLTSDQPDAIVEVSNLTYWTNATHGNHAPLANAGADRSVEVTDPLATVVQLDGSGSSDPDGDDLTYVWTLPDPANAGQEGIVAVGQTPTVELPLGGYTFTLFVRDPFDGVAQPQTVIVEVEYPFTRGDANADGQINIADPITTLTSLFLDTSKSICLDAADTDDDGVVNISDPIALLGSLFLGSADPKPPFPNAGLDPTPELLGCNLKQP